MNHRHPVPICTLFASLLLWAPAFADAQAIEETFGNTLRLTLDREIQMYAERELRRPTLLW